jgi:hypothetical protein
MTICYSCKEEIENGDWVVPLETYRAIYRGESDDVALDADDTVETLVHLKCITDNGEQSDGSGSENNAE